MLGSFLSFLTGKNLLSYGVSFFIFGLFSSLFFIFSIKGADMIFTQMESYMPFIFNLMLYLGIIDFFQTSMGLLVQNAIVLYFFNYFKGS